MSDLRGEWIEPFDPAIQGLDTGLAFALEAMILPGAKMLQLFKLFERVEFGKADVGMRCMTYAQCQSDGNQVPCWIHRIVLELLFVCGSPQTR